MAYSSSSYASPSPSPSYHTHLPLHPSSLFLQGEKRVVDDRTRVPIRLVTSATQLPVEFLRPSPWTKVVIGFDTEGACLSRRCTLRNAENFN